MTPVEISRFFAGRDIVWRRYEFTALTEDYAEDGEVERHCDDFFSTKGDSL